MLYCTVHAHPKRIPHRIIEGRAFRAMLLNHSAVETLMTKSQWAWIPDFKVPRQRCLEVSRQPIFEAVSTCTVDRMTYAATALDQNWMHLTL